MDFELSSKKINTSGVEKRAPIKEGAYGVNDVLMHGFGNVKACLESAHPLEESEKKFHMNQDRMNMQMLQRIQGIHAPIRMMMENKAASQVGRLPCLSSSNIMLNSLQDKLETIGPEDIFNSPFESEIMGYPSIMMEKKLGF